KHVRKKYRTTPGQSLLYQRPYFSNDPHIFRDLVAYAPGLHSNNSDLLGVLEAEGATPAVKQGKIDDKARALIDRARSARWQRLTLPGADDTTTFVCDGAGRYHLERTLSTGLKEVVICDGKTLLHLYPELGLAARRSVTRFHRAEFGHVVPWAVP